MGTVYSAGLKSWLMRSVSAPAMLAVVPGRGVLAAFRARMEADRRRANG